MKTLITLLGTSPGTVTTAYYALTESPAHGPPDRVVIVATDAPETSHCLEMIHDTLGPVVFPDPPIIVPIEDLKDGEDTDQFQAKIVEVLRLERDRPNNEVWLSVAGGRKSMAALAAIAAQIVGVDRMFHIYVIPELEQHGDVNALILEPAWKERCLHPAPDEYTLVEVPFFTGRESPERLKLLLAGESNAFFQEIVRARPEILEQVDDDTIKAFWKSVIERKGPPPEYEDLVISIGPAAAPEGDFPVTAYGDGGGDVRSFFHPPFDAGAVNAFVESAQLLHPTREQQNAAQRLGEQIFGSLFTGDLLRAYYRKESQVDTTGRRLRLRLRLAPDACLGDVPLSRLPWELMCEGQSFMGVERKRSIVRHFETARPVDRMDVEGGVRMLVAAASPSDLTDLRQYEELELQALYDKVKLLAIRIVVAGLDGPPRTFEALKRRLAEIRPHVLYFTGHGMPGSLVFEKEDGTQDKQPAEKVAALLTGQGVRLIVLNACHGAQSPAPDVHSVAEALVAAGLPAVVAMQSVIRTGKSSQLPAIRFTEDFFFHLALGWPVDACVTEARFRIQQTFSTSFQWALPVCCMRSGDGRLFSFEDS